MIGIQMVHRRHCVPFDVVLLQESDAPHHFFEGMVAIGIVESLRAVDGDAY